MSSTAASAPSDSAARHEPPQPASPPGRTDDLTTMTVVGIAHGCSHFFHLFIPALFPFLREGFGLSYAELGGITTVFFVVSGIGQALAGFVVDRIGGFKVLVFGMGCFIAASLLAAVAQSAAVLVAVSALAGLGNSVFHPADFTILNQRVTKSRLGPAFSVHGVAGNLGWAAATGLLVPLASFWNWRVAAIAATVIAVAVLVMVLVFASHLSTQGPRSHAQAHDQHGLAFLKLPVVWLCFSFFLLTTVSMSGVQAFGTSALTAAYAMTLAAATAAVTAYLVGMAVGTAAGGWVAHRGMEPRRIIASSFLTAALLFAVVATGALPAWLVTVLFALGGFFSGVAGPSRDLMIRAATPPGAIGRVYGTVYSGLDVGLAVGPLMFGVLMDKHLPLAVLTGVAVFQALAIITAVQVKPRDAVADRA